MTSSLVVAVLACVACLLLADSALSQTFSYSRGWKSGKRAVHPLAVGARVGRTSEDILAEDLPLYRYFLESLGDHRAPYDTWRMGDEPLVHFARRPPQHHESPLQPLSADQPGEHDER